MEITETLINLGLEVEKVSDPALKLKPFTLAKTLEAVQHLAAGLHGDDR